MKEGELNDLIDNAAAQWDRPYKSLIRLFGEGVRRLTRIADQGEPKIKDGLITHRIYRDTLEDVLLLIRKSDMGIEDRTAFIKRLNDTLDKVATAPDVTGLVEKAGNAKMRLNTLLTISNPSIEYLRANIQHAYDMLKSALAAFERGKPKPTPDPEKFIDNLTKLLSEDDGDEEFLERGMAIVNDWHRKQAAPDVGLDETDKFEILAKLFHQETRIMAPGKSVAPTSGDTTSPEERRKRWDTWLKEKGYFCSHPDVAGLVETAKSLLIALRLSITADETGKEYRQRIVDDYGELGLANLNQFKATLAAHKPEVDDG